MKRPRRMGWCRASYDEQTERWKWLNLRGERYITVFGVFLVQGSRESRIESDHEVPTEAGAMTNCRTRHADRSKYLITWLSSLNALAHEGHQPLCRSSKYNQTVRPAHCVFHTRPYHSQVSSSPCPLLACGALLLATLPVSDGRPAPVLLETGLVE